MSFLENVGDLAGSVKAKIEDVADRIDDAIDIDIVVDDESVKAAAEDCHWNARETSELCDQTVTKAREMVDFGMEIRSTLGGLSEGEGGVLDASVLASIRDLVSGDRVRAAMSLAGELDDLALACVDRSVKMISAMEAGVDALHMDWIEDKLEAANDKGSEEGDPELPDVEPDVRELSDCVEAVRNVNLFTVMDAGVNAFHSLAAKGEICKEMFDAIKSFAEDVVGVSDAVRNFGFREMVGKMQDLVRDVWRCLRLSNLIKQFAEQVGKLINWIIDLFREASERLGEIWGALVFAKDCMADCVQHILEAMRLCDDAREKSTALIDTSGEIKDHLDNLKSMNQASITSIRDLMDGEEIRRAIELAANMDDVLKAAVEKIIAMVKRVTEGFDNLPGVIKDGIPDVIEAGTKETDPEPADVQGDVEDLNKCRGAIDECDTFNVFRVSSDGFSGVREKVVICREMIASSRGFAEDCNGTIDSFLGVWDLRVAMEKILEMCRLVRLGAMMRQFAEQIMELVRANIALMNAAKEKITSIDFVPDNIEDAVEDVVDDIKDFGEKLAFWKK